MAAPDQLKIDRYIGARYVNEAYADRSLISSDQEYYRGLTTSEKKFINLLARRTKGDEIPYESIIEAFNFYNNASKQTKEIWNRLVYSRALVKAGSSYRALPPDYAFVNSFSEGQKESVQRIADHRKANGRLISEDFLVESIDVLRRPSLTT